MLHARGITLPVIIMTGHGDVPMAVRAMKSGAMDFIEKPFNDQLLLDRVHQALSRDAVQRHHDAQRRQIRARLQSLTAREREVYDLIVRGKSNKLVARQLNVSVRTVELHRARVMQKDLVGYGAVICYTEIHWSNARQVNYGCHGKNQAAS
jgi:FixJ family two-component response regulator